jgi:hypothetical protein
MRVIRRLAARLGLVAAVATLLAGLFTTPASAVPFVVCDSYPAPSISASGGYLTMHYYHKCNTVSGVTSMAGHLDLHGPSSAGYVIVDTVKGEAASTRTKAVGSDHGNYYVVETLYFSGNFTSGPAPHGGCGRISSTTVRCEWRSTTIFA